MHQANKRLSVIEPLQHASPAISPVGSGWENNTMTKDQFHAELDSLTAEQARRLICYLYGALEVLYPGHTQLMEDGLKEARA